MKQWKRMMKGSFTILLILLGFLFYTAAGIYTYGKKDESMPADAAIVLGAAVWGDRPSPVFRERIRHAVALYKQGKVERIILRGASVCRMRVRSRMSQETTRSRQGFLPR